MAATMASMVTLVIALQCVLSRVESAAKPSDLCFVNPLCLAGCSCCLINPSELVVSCYGASVPENEFEISLNKLLKKNGSSISTLNVTHSPITNLGNLALCNLHNISTLILDNNSLKTLGEGQFECLQTLRHLSADNNHITSIVNSTFRGIDRLLSLSLQNNRIETISPTALTGFKAIGEVLLSNNIIQYIDVWPIFLMCQVSGYTHIDLSHNEIETFTNDLQWMYNDRARANFSFDISYNRIKYMTDLSYAVGLRTTLDVFSFLRTHVHDIDFRGNPLQCDCVDFFIVQIIKYSHHDPRWDELYCDNVLAFNNNIMSIPYNDFVCDVTENCTSGCDCIERPADRTVNINCQNRGLLNIPPAIPSKLVGRYDYTFKYILRLANNAIKDISWRPYLDMIDTADFSHNYVRSLDINVLKHMTSMSYIHLDNNKLTTLPHEITSMEFKNMRNMTLHKNPWHCDCEHTWFKSWILNMTGKFCSDPVQDKIVRIITITVSVIGSVVVVISTSLSVAYYMRVRVFARLKWHPFNHDECQGENKEFDVFVSYATEDEDWVGELIRNLEEKGYRILFHRRDFIGGQSITENVALAVERSKRTLCVLSRDFAASNMCMWEFTTALNIDLLENKHRLITILKELIPVEEQDPSLKDYLRRFTYIEADSRHFWDNLCYSLSVKKIGPTTTEPNEQLNRSTESLDEEEAMQGPLDHQMPLLNMVAT
nr:Toll-like receptor 14 [Arenicola marina]